MNAQIDLPASGSSDVEIPASSPASAQTETAPAADSQICWIELKQYPYQPDHQVELLHLQAEADALLLQLQTLSQKKMALQGSLSNV